MASSRSMDVAACSDSCSVTVWSWSIVTEAPLADAETASGLSKAGGEAVELAVLEEAGAKTTLAELCRLHKYLSQLVTQPC